MIKKLLAADIGGSQTRLQLSDINGNILSEVYGVGVASAVDDTSPLPSLEKLLYELPDKEQIAAIAINLGGRNTEQVLSAFRLFFPDVPTRIFRESEGAAAYALGEEYGASIILMAGTGAIAVGTANGKFVTTGGWGVNIGDDGSGYDIGLQAIRLSLQALDGTEALCPLAKFLCGCEEPLSATDSPSLYRDKRDAIREKLYPLDRQHIASFARVVTDFAELGDPIALDIFNDVSKKLSELVIKTAKKLGATASTVVVTGGLVHAKNFWAGAFERLLPGIKVHYIEDGLLCGTRRIAKELYESGDKRI